MSRMPPSSGDAIVASVRQAQRGNLRDASARAARRARARRRLRPRDSRDCADPDTRMSTSYSVVCRPRSRTSSVDRRRTPSTARNARALAASAVARRRTSAARCASVAARAARDASAALSTARAPREKSAHFVSSRRSREPMISRCASPTLVRMPICGRAISTSAATSP